MKVKGIIYDFDGVICDSVNVKTEAFSEMYKLYGEEVQSQVVRYHLMHGGVSRFDKIKYFHNNFLGKKISNIEIDELAEQFSLLVKEKVISSKFIKGADIFLEKNCRDFIQFICTGTPENEIVDICDRRNLSGYFEGIYGSPKKKIGIIDLILFKTGIKPSHFLYFGDAITDYEAAKTFDMPFVGILSPDTIFPTGTNVISNFEDIELSNIIQ